MTIIGVDVSKANLVAVRVSRSGILKESFEIDNTEIEVGKWLDQLNLQYSQLLVASEATGDYHLNVAKGCLSREIPFRLLNPILTKQFNRATIRRKKTDLTDAEIIAKLALQGEGSKVGWGSFASAKTMHRTAIKLTKLNQTLKLMSTRFPLVVPEEKELGRQLKKCVRMLDKSSTLFHVYAKDRTDSRLVKLLCSIVGIGPRIAVTLINEIDDVARFSSPKALIAYAGLDPRVKQSGLALKHNTHITKRGSVYLRRMVFIAATIASKHDLEMQVYYEKKIGEGKRYKEAMVALSRKLLNRVYAVWKRGTPYERRTAAIGT